MSANSMSVNESPQFQRVHTVETTESATGVTPVTPMPVTANHEPVIVELPASVSRTSFTRRFAPDAVIASAAGLVLLVAGLIAITRGGFDGPMNLPVVHVLGFTHTTTLGLIEIVLGGCLLIAGATGSRSGAIFLGAVLGIGAFVDAVQTSSFKSSLELESGLAWLLVIAAAVVVTSAMVVPRYTKHSTIVRPL